MPFISVIVPTNRVGGLDVLFDGLSAQSFQDFELVLVDGIHQWRSPLIREHLSRYRFPVKHVAPLHNMFPLSAFCRSVNTGLVYAQGHIVLFLCDYTWCPPGLLEYHAQFHQASSGRQGLMCPHQYYSTPDIESSFGSYSDSDRSYDARQTERYAEDVRNGRLNNLMWSMFAKTFDSSSIAVDSVMGGSDPKLQLKERAPVAGPYFNWYAKNESCELDAFLEVNGFDEELDGTNCCQDLDIADRLNVLTGMGWVADPNNVNRIVNPRYIFPCPIRTRPHQTNGDIWAQKRVRGYPGLVNLWSIRGMRLRLGITK